MEAISEAAWRERSTFEVRGWSIRTVSLTNQKYMTSIVKTNAHRKLALLSVCIPSSLLDADMENRRNEAEMPSVTRARSAAAGLLRPTAARVCHLNMLDSALLNSAKQKSRNRAHGINGDRCRPDLHVDPKINVSARGNKAHMQLIPATRRVNPFCNDGSLQLRKQI